MEINQHLTIVLNGLQEQMMGVHKAGTGMNNKSKGAVREQFIKTFLEKILPPIYRIGREGEIVDADQN